MKVSWDDEIPNIWKINTCSKPPTRKLIGVINQLITDGASPSAGGAKITKDPRDFSVLKSTLVSNLM
jgi:hypothetical protein